MYVVWLALILIGLKVAEIGPLADLSWWWVLMPLGVAFVWFEWLEKLFGFDKRRKERVAQQFATPDGTKRRS
jgi:small Trp-rich protein